MRSRSCAPAHGSRAALTVAAVLAMTVLAAAAPVVADPAEPTPPTSTSTPFSTPNTDTCPQKNLPRPPIDASEVPAPGEPTPGPLPVPVPAIGGERMSECGVVVPDDAPELPADISATAWLVSDLDTGAVLAAKDPHGRYRPASTIKVLLAIVALRTLDMDRVVVGTQEAADVEGSRVGIGPGGRYTNRQLMQALVMVSGNDAAHMIAAQLGGDEAAVAKMNEVAKSLSALDTRVATPSGLDGPGMSTSAYDLSALWREAMSIPLFAELIATEQIEFPGYPADPRIPDDTDHPGFPIANDNHLLFDYEGALGGKTGFTDDARQTFVAAAERDGHRLAVTLLQADVRPIRPWEQAARLLDYGFALSEDAEVAAVGALPGAEVFLDEPTVVPAAPPLEGDLAAPHTVSHADTRALLVIVGSVAVVVLLLGAFRVNRRHR
ncbi:D-alanyl-D-alanine carboxypeptidase family protein [Nocardia shimofusensis]|uniref:D-alanyl-D-alanine carboxypeptidase family protein n=1 Tax=Nocardia shimofusensis TaxID=228596 RepID=UPI000833B90C|nr:D-alanyl-D-alanine carboxypeptidase family protein [Nocardia shimofusensis]